MTIATTPIKAAAAKKADNPPITSAPEPEPARNIFQLVSLISAEAGALEKITSAGLKYSFRGVDGTINHLSPYLRKYGVIVVPNVVEHKVTSNSAGGTRIVKTTEVTTRFDFYAPDGSMFSATTAGLADDFGDKSTAQAQSVAYRTVLLQTFALPTMNAEPEETGAHVENGRAAQSDTVKQESTVAAQLRATIGTLIADAANAYDGPMVNALGDEITGKDRAAWMNSAADLKKVIAAVQAGQVATVSAAA